MDKSAENDENLDDQVYIPSDVLRSMPTNNGNGCKYTSTQRYNAALAWAITGNAEAAANMVSLPGHLVRKWTGEAWWLRAVDVVVRLKRREMDGRLQGILEKGLDVLSNRLEHGDTVLHNGQERRLPVRAKDAAVIVGIVYDKLALLRGQVTSRTERVNLNAIRHSLGVIVEGESQTIVTPEQETQTNIDIS